LNIGLDLILYEDSYKLVEAPYLGMEHQAVLHTGMAIKMGTVAGI
jgi:hypothetical protein